jgi:hypothetical protein
MNVVTTTTTLVKASVSIQSTPGPPLVRTGILLLWVLAAVLVSGGLAAVVTVGADGGVSRQRYGVPLAAAGTVAVIIGAVILAHLV